MTKPKIFVSFDFENDRSYKYTLNMWNAEYSAGSEPLYPLERATLSAW